jgi:hypothetical protein
MKPGLNLNLNFSIMAKILSSPDHRGCASRAKRTGHRTWSGHSQRLCTAQSKPRANTTRMREQLASRVPFFRSFSSPGVGTNKSIVSSKIFLVHMLALYSPDVFQTSMGLYVKVAHYRSLAVSF